MFALLFWILILPLSTVAIVPVWQRMLEDSRYPFLPLLLILLVVLTLVRWNRRFAWPSVMGGLLILAGIASIALSYREQSPWLAGLGWCLITLSFLSSCTQVADDKQFAWLKRLSGSPLGLAPMVLFCLPIPRNFDTVIITLVYEITANLSSMTLDAFSIPHHWQEGILKFQSFEYSVKELFPTWLSPLNCCFALIVLQVLRNRPVWIAPFYFAGGLATSFVANYLFTLTVIHAKVNFNYDLYQLWPYTGTIAVVILLSILFALSLDRFWLVTFSPTRPDEISGWNNPMIRGWNFLSRS